MEDCLKRRKEQICRNALVIAGSASSVPADSSLPAISQTFSSRPPGRHKQFDVVASLARRVSRVRANVCVHEDMLPPVRRTGKTNSNRSSREDNANDRRDASSSRRRTQISRWKTRELECATAISNVTPFLPVRGECVKLARFSSKMTLSNAVPTLCTALFPSRYSDLSKHFRTKGT